MKSLCKAAGAGASALIDGPSRLRRALRRALPLAALPAAVLLETTQARADLTITFTQSGNDVVTTITGSFAQLPTPFQEDQSKFTSPGFSPSSGAVSTINALNFHQMDIYEITGPAGFGTNNVAGGIVTTSGTKIVLYAANNQLWLPAGFTAGTSINATTTQLNATFANTGLTSPSNFEWTLNGTTEKIFLNVGSAPAPGPSSVPGPLPLLGAGAAFGFSRRLRSRLSHRKASLQG